MNISYIADSREVKVTDFKGETLPVVICYLEAGETMITESGVMAWMSTNMNMETTSNGGPGKAFGRMFSGESLFQNRIWRREAQV